MLDAARHAPRRPDVEQPDLALEIAGRERLAGIVQLRQRKRRRRLADQRRGHLARIAPQSDPQERKQHDEDRQRYRPAQHFHRTIRSVARRGAGQRAEPRVAPRGGSAGRRRREIRRAPSGTPPARSSRRTASGRCERPTRRRSRRRRRPARRARRSGRRNAGIDRRDRHRLSGRVVDALFGLQRLDQLPVVAHLDRADAARGSSVPAPA